MTDTTTDVRSPVRPRKRSPIALALVYYDERVRKEAFDLTHMMQQLEQAGASPVA